MVMIHLDFPSAGSRVHRLASGSERRDARPGLGLFVSHLCFLVVVLSVLAGSAAQAMDPPKSRGGAYPGTGIHILDGRTFRGAYGPLGKPARREDLFIFSDGRFVSKNCQEYGFTAGPYWVREVGGAVHFRAELTSPEHGVMIYEGRTQGDKLKAKFTWTKERWYWTIQREFWFEGKRVHGQ
jgi:hypothetical protein